MPQKKHKPEEIVAKLRQWEPQSIHAPAVIGDFFHDEALGFSGQHAFVL